MAFAPSLATESTVNTTAERPAVVECPSRRPYCAAEPLLPNRCGFVAQDCSFSLSSLPATASVAQLMTQTPTRSPPAWLREAHDFLNDEPEHCSVSMAPQLAPSQREQIHAMILRGVPNSDIAGTVGCNERAIRRIQSRLRRYGTTTSPPNRIGRERKITPLMRDALFEQLTKQPDMFRYEMINFLYDRFGLEVSPTTISRMLKTEKWSKKTNGRVAKQRNSDLREFISIQAL
jgi:transposase